MSRTRWNAEDVAAFIARGQRAQDAVNADLAKFEPNSGRGLPKETLAEMRKQAKELAERRKPIDSHAPVVAVRKPPKRSKYGNISTVVDGIRFASKLEAQRYAQLKLMQKGGEVAFFLRQVPFDLPGGIRYVADFLVFRLVQGPAVKTYLVGIEDAKGYATREFKLKAKQVRALYDIPVTQVR